MLAVRWNDLLGQLFSLIFHDLWVNLNSTCRVEILLNIVIFYKLQQKQATTLLNPLSSYLKKEQGTVVNAQ